MPLNSSENNSLNNNNSIPNELYDNFSYKD